MQIRMLYGRDGLTVRLPEAAEATVIEKPPMPVPASPEAVVAQAFANPVGSATLAELARGRKSACILICDITRPVPNGRFLQPMVRMMVEAGIPLEAITILVATGLHRPNEGAELAELVGDPWVLENVRVENHFALDDAAHVELGTTSNGVPVTLDRRLVEADLKIATGLVEPHFMAGYSGGRKVVAPGVAGHRTIRTFHSARFMGDPAATQCNLVNNPLHEAQLEIVRQLGDVYALNTVLDDRRNLIFASFGEIIESHLAAVDFVRAFTEIPVGRRFRTVLTSAAGYPLDQTYYQTVKGMVTPIDILEPGGTLIIASSCNEGIGSAHYREAQERLVAEGPDAFLDRINAKRFADIDEWQTQKQLEPMRIGEVVLFTKGLSPADLEITGVTVTDDLDATIASALERNGPEIAVIPEGPYVVPFARKAPLTEAAE